MIILKTSSSSQIIVSKSLLVSDLINLYEENEIPELNIQYKDFAVWQKDLLNSEKITKLEEYWLKVFDTDEEIPVLNLPTDYIKGACSNEFCRGSNHFFNQ